MYSQKESLTYSMQEPLFGSSDNVRNNRFFSHLEQSYNNNSSFKRSKTGFYNENLCGSTSQFNDRSSLNYDYNRRGVRSISPLSTTINDCKSNTSSFCSCACHIHDHCFMHCHCLLSHNLCNDSTSNFRESSICVPTMRLIRSRGDADEYIKRLQDELNKSPEMQSLNQGKIRRSYSQMGLQNENRYYDMLDKSFEVLNKVGEQSKDPKALIRGGIEYYFDKKPDYNEVIERQKEFLDALRKANQSMEPYKGVNISTAPNTYTSFLFISPLIISNHFSLPFTLFLLK